MGELDLEYKGTWDSLYVCLGLTREMDLLLITHAGNTHYACTSQNSESLISLMDSSSWPILPLHLHIVIPLRKS